MMTIFAAVSKGTEKKASTLNKEKCVYNKTSLDFLGYTFTKDGMEVDRKKIAAVVKLPNPTNQT